MRPEEAGQIVGPSLELAGASGSAVTPEVPVEGGGPTTMPQEPAGVGGSSTTPKVPVEGVASLPRPKGQPGRANLPPRLRYRWRGVAPPPCP